MANIIFIIQFQSQEISMLTIGTFTKLGDDYVGGIAMHNLQEKAAILPNHGKIARRTPDYQVVANGARVGDAWIATSHDRELYLAVTLDAPVMEGKIFCHLLDEGYGQHRLVWSR